MPSCTGVIFAVNHVCLSIQANRQLRLESDKEMYARRLQLERAAAEQKATEANKRYLISPAASCERKTIAKHQQLHVHSVVRPVLSSVGTYSLAETHTASSLPAIVIAHGLWSYTTSSLDWPQYLQ